MQTKAFSENTTRIFLMDVSAKCLSFDLGFLKISKGVIHKELYYLPKQKLPPETTWTSHFKIRSNLTKYVQRDWENNYVTMTLLFFCHSVLHIEVFDQLQEVRY